MFRYINKCKNKKGFTLIELIVVLAVLGIIAAIAVPKYLGVQEAAKADADYATGMMIAKAAELQAARENKTSGSYNSGTLTGVDFKEFQSKHIKGQTDYTATIESGSVKVEVSGYVLYPRPADEPLKN